jgi:hypothetical protein
MSLDPWGNESWDTQPWNGNNALPQTLDVVGAAAEAENVVRVQFGAAAYFSGILDGADISETSNWTVAPVAGSVGNDGNAARAVRVVNVQQPVVAGEALGVFVDLYLDRPMTPYPAKYVVTVASAYSADQTQRLNPAANTATIFATYRELVPVDIQAVVPGRDIANPQTAQQLADSTIANAAIAQLGSFGYSDDGDYGIDKGDDGLFKRLWRRFVSKPASFLHLGQAYGAGVRTYVKQLGSGAARGRLAAACEDQATQEPEVASAKVRCVPSAQHPNKVKLGIVLVKKGGQSKRYSMLVPTGR